MLIIILAYSFTKWAFNKVDDFRIDLSVYSPGKRSSSYSL